MSYSYLSFLVVAFGTTVNKVVDSAYISKYTALVAPNLSL